MIIQKNEKDSSKKSIIISPTVSAKWLKYVKLCRNISTKVASEAIEDIFENIEMQQPMNLTGNLFYEEINERQTKKILGNMNEMSKSLLN